MDGNFALSAPFRPLKGINPPIWHFQPSGKRLFVNTDFIKIYTFFSKREKGLTKYFDRNIIQIADGRVSFSIT